MCWEEGETGWLEDDVVLVIPWEIKFSRENVWENFGCRCVSFVIVRKKMIVTEASRF